MGKWSPDTDISDIPKNMDIYHINTEDASVFRDDPPLSDESSNDHNHYEDNSSLNDYYDHEQEVLDEDVEDYNHNHDYGYDPDPPNEDYVWILLMRVLDISLYV